MDPHNKDAAFRLCNVGFGSFEIGYLSLSALATVYGRFGLPVEATALAEVQNYFAASAP